jgi:hypothetical protein
MRLPKDFRLNLISSNQLNENQSEVLNRSHRSLLSDSSLKENRNCFKHIFNSKKKVEDTMDYAIETVPEKRWERVL